MFLYRFLNGKKLLVGDKNHLSHKFLNTGFNPNHFAYLIFIINFFIFLFYIFIDSITDYNFIIIAVIIFYLSLSILLSSIYIYGNIKSSIR